MVSSSPPTSVQARPVTCPILFASSATAEVELSTPSSLQHSGVTATPAAFFAQQ
jgi:hypothetical protein